MTISLELLTPPAEIAEHLVEIALKGRSPAYIQVTPEGRIITWKGAVGKYGITHIKEGDDVCDRLFFLKGFFPLEQANDVLPQVQTERGPVVDVHLIKDDTSSWILLLDATDAAERQQRLQQKGNDLSLLRQQYTKLLDACISDPQRAEIIAGHIPTATHEMSVMLVKICHLNDYNNHSTPASTLRTLNTYISLITRILVEEGGVINHVIGGTVAAFFGVLPTEQPPAHQAVYAAKRLITKFHPIDKEAAAPAASILGLGVGVTTGKATAGIVQACGLQAINAVGEHVQPALQLSELIMPNTVVTDAATFRAIGKYSRKFNSQPIKVGEHSHKLTSQAVEDIYNEATLYRLSMKL